MHAASSGHVAVCNLLVQHPYITAEDVRWAVREAAAAGQLDVLQLLITSCPDAASPDLRGCPLSEAAHYGQVQAMQLLLQHGADINGTPGTPWSEPYQMQWPLQSAVAQGHVAAVQWMLEQGADAGPALATAAEVGNLPVLRLLLDWGADISTWGGLAFRAALGECQTHAACLLLGAGPADYFMSAAPPHPNLELADISLRASNYVEKIDYQQASALWQAAVQRGHRWFAQLLEQEGVALPTSQVHPHT
jgi:ankyrin repeat protein